MLQQTTVKTVVPQIVCEKISTNSELARANLEDVLSIWSGLGYYRRANYLLQSQRLFHRIQ